MVISMICVDVVRCSTDEYLRLRAKLRKEIENDESETEVSLEQRVFLHVDIEESFDFDKEREFNFAMDVARYLAYAQEPSTDSWGFAGKSYQMGQFCQRLWERIHAVELGMDEGDHENNEV